MFRNYFPAEETAEPKIPLAKRVAAFYIRQFEFIKRTKRYLRFSIFIFLLTTAALIKTFITPLVYRLFA
jgi:hypothetical protein